MKNPGQLVYKCRRCGEKEKSTHAPDINMAVIFIALGIETPKDWGPINPKMTYVHSCTDGNIGVCDLIGGEKDQEDND